MNNQRLANMRKLERGEVIIQQLPDFVSTVFYRRPDVQLWMNDMGLAFGGSKPSTPAEIKLALDWLASKLGGTITWESGHA